MGYPINKTNEYKSFLFEETPLCENAKEFLSEAELILFKYIVVYGYDRKKIQDEFGIEISKQSFDSISLNLMNKIVIGLNDRIAKLERENEIYSRERDAIDDYFASKEVTIEEYERIFSTVEYDDAPKIYKIRKEKNKIEKNNEKIIDTIKSIVALEKEKGYIVTFSANRALGGVEQSRVRRHDMLCHKSNNSGVYDLVRQTLSLISTSIEKNEKEIEKLMRELEEREESSDFPTLDIDEL